MKISAKSLSLRASLVGAAALAGMCVVPATANAASTCTDLVVGYSQQYDYAWITDYNEDCGYTAVKHQYYPNGPAAWTSWRGGALYHYESPREAQMTSVKWTWPIGSKSKSGIPA